MGIWSGVGTLKSPHHTLEAMADACRAPGLIQRYREELQVRHCARRTVNTYEQWLRRFLLFHGRRHPRAMGSAEVNAFLNHPELGVRAQNRHGAGCRWC